MLTSVEWNELNNLALLIHGVADFKQMQRNFLNAAKLAISYEKACFYILSENANGHISIQSSVCINLSREVILNYEELLNTNILGKRVINLRRTLAYRSSDLLSNAEMDSNAFLQKNRITSYAGIVFFDGNTLLGELIFYRIGKQKGFSDTEIDILNILKEHLLIRLRNEILRPSQFERQLKRFMQSDFDLTRREREIISLLMENNSTDEIADILVISPFTVKKHLNHIYKKLCVNNRNELISIFKTL